MYHIIVRDPRDFGLDAGPNQISVTFKFSSSGVAQQLMTMPELSDLLVNNKDWPDDLVVSIQQSENGPIKNVTTKGEVQEQGGFLTLQVA